MISVLISIKPKWCELIASGKKTIEVRKTKPKSDVPFKCYMYCTKDMHNALVVGNGEAKVICCTNLFTAIPCGGAIGNGKVIGEFVCNGSIVCKNVLDLINRQKAEIERLQNILICFMESLGKVRKVDDIDEISQIPILSELNKQYRASIKSEAYKEFAERLCDGKVSNDKTVIEVKVLLKEMVGDE